jgi:hypothetical protein
MGVKKLEVRIAESVEIRKQLKTMGVLVIPEVVAKIRKASEDFINNAESQQVTLQLPFEETKIVVNFTINEHNQSGITVLK